MMAAIRTCFRCFEPSVTARPRRDVCRVNVTNSMRDLTIAHDLTIQDSRPCRLVVCIAIHQYMIDHFQIHRNQSQRLRRRIG